DFFQGVATIRSPFHSRRSQARHRPRPDRSRRGGAVRLTRRPRPADRPVSRLLQHAGIVRRGCGPRGRRNRADSRVRLVGNPPGAVDQGLMTAKLTISQLGKTFGALHALQDINVTVERGEFISVVGPSGCGKTTFLRIVAGLERATAGEVLLDGRAVRGPGTDRGFVFQTDNLLPWRTVYANAIIGRELAGKVGRAERQHTIELLKLVGLEGFENYHPRQLSGGMRQRVNLARAL